MPKYRVAVTGTVILEGNYNPKTNRICLIPQEVEVMVDSGYRIKNGVITDQEIPGASVRFPGTLRLSREKGVTHA